MGNWNNLSIFPMIPFIGMIPLFGGIYVIRKSIPRNFLTGGAQWNRPTYEHRIYLNPFQLRYDPYRLKIYFYDLPYLYFFVFT